MAMDIQRLFSKIAAKIQRFSKIAAQMQKLPQTMRPQTLSLLQIYCRRRYKGFFICKRYLIKITVWIKRLLVIDGPADSKVT